MAHPVSAIFKFNKNNNFFKSRRAFPGHCLHRAPENVAELCHVSQHMEH
ncbi:hypothetical protein BN134_2500 [Cronobacter dublinensis 1210]|uniref:Uncharacterized protein n=1 Tax=Cronobacter dublinensis 1210 TaxID=1208656 RepID=A0ABP1W9J4_9ENTR|nr:hypothetical protein BN134_2500 [Cronobacter dublinensis 1210]